MMFLADGEFGPDGIGWLLLWELVKGVLRGDFIVFGPAMWVFLGVLGAFVVTRGITRFIRRRSTTGAAASGPIKDITIGGVHIHHQVFGIILMFLTGLLLVATSPQDLLLDVLALLFGVGVGLAFDEFALWLHLDDVYWSQQGRKSLDAVAIVLVVTASVRAFLDLLQVFQTSAEMGDLAWLLWFLVAITVIPAVVCLLKGKLVTTALGIVYQPIGIIGACRLAKPGSFWARHLYGPRSRRLTRAERRFGAAYAARLDRWRDIVGGAPADRDVTPPDTYVTPPDTTTAGEPIGGAPADPTGLTKKIGHRAVDRKNSCRRAKATMKGSCDLGLSVLHDVRTRPWRALVARSAGAPDTCPRARSPSRPVPLPSAALTRRCFP